ncbi:hypothetical protein BPULL_2090 [Bifidobacterium pullorum]|uniref:Uncharacterized protein n=1 Tax=Bifidobacterium pullorum TaxID=78448 RepID=A0A7V8HQ80_9BIFI|nr:hypothetical protein BPULL_2090 [Bifidobacterium pullorum]
MNCKYDEFCNKNRESSSCCPPSTVKDEIKDKTDGHPSHVCPYEFLFEVKRSKHTKTYKCAKTGKKVYETDKLY